MWLEGSAAVQQEVPRGPVLDENISHLGDQLHKPAEPEWSE